MKGNINIIQHHPSRRIPPGRFRKILTRIVRLLRINGQEISFVFLNDRAIRKINRQFLRHDWATDVIAFPSGGGGEILISLDTARRQAEEEGHSVFEEVKILAIHGLLHLVGYDDRKKRDHEKMWWKTIGQLPGIL